VKVKPNAQKAKLVRNGAVIHYNGQITFEPPLKKGAYYRHASGRDDCLMLLEAIYK
jgi:hypothetical protein